MSGSKLVLIAPSSPRSLIRAYYLHQQLPPNLYEACTSLISEPSTIYSYQPYSVGKAVVQSNSSPESLLPSSNSTGVFSGYVVQGKQHIARIEGTYNDAARLLLFAVNDLAITIASGANNLPVFLYPGFYSLGVVPLEEVLKMHRQKKY